MQGISFHTSSKHAAGYFLTQKTKTLEFSCQANGQEMKVNALPTVATNG